MSEPPLKAAVIPVTPLQQNCTLLWCTKTIEQLDGAKTTS